MPFDSEALVGSLANLTDESPPSDIAIEEGYADWENANGGVFTVSVSQAIDFVLDASGIRVRK